MAKRKRHARAEDSAASLPDPAAASDQQRALEYLNAGARLLAQHKPGEAAALLEDALALDPHNVAVAINLGGAYILQRRYAKAIPLLETACQREPDNAMAWVNLAAAYLGRLELSDVHQQDRAIDAFERALLADPQTPHVNYNLGLIYKERGDVARALAHFWRALEINPDDRDARYWIELLGRSDATDPARTGDDADGASSSEASSS